jgi:hypothetical protein
MTTVIEELALYLAYMYQKISVGVFGTHCEEHGVLKQSRFGSLALALE